jgi:hypothetical protein
MSRIRWAMLGIAMTLLVGCSRSAQPAEDGQAERLEGSWVITSVQRDGKPDPLQVGAQMTFTANQATFQPTVRQFVDEMS